MAFKSSKNMFFNSLIFNKIEVAHYLKKRKLFIFFLLGSFLVSCESKPKKSAQKDPLPSIIKKEEQEKSKFLNESQNIKYYKGVKTLLRSYMLPENKRPDLVNNPTVRLGTKYLYKIIDGNFSYESIDPMDALILMNLPKDIKSVQQRINELDEHSYPTITENIYSIAKINNPPIKDPGIEHFLLLCLLDLSEWDQELMLYEANQVDISQLPNNEIKPIAAYYKSTVLLQLGYPALAYKAAKEGQESIDKNIHYSGTFNVEIYGSKTKLNKLDQLKKTGELLQAVCLSEIDEPKLKKQGIENLQLIKEDMKSDKEVNEITLLTEALLYSLKENDNRKFNPLTNSDILGFSDRGTILRQLQAQQNPTKVRRLVSSVIITNFLFQYLKTTDFYQGILDSEKGKDLLSIFDRLDSAKNLPYVRDVLKF